MGLGATAAKAHRHKNLECFSIIRETRLIPLRFIENGFALSRIYAPAEIRSGSFALVPGLLLRNDIAHQIGCRAEPCNHKKIYERFKVFQKWNSLLREKL